jgi:hypothetical protein
MSDNPLLQSLLDEILDLPDQVQTELVETLIRMRAEDTGLYDDAS